MLMDKSYVWIHDAGSVFENNLLQYHKSALVYRTTVIANLICFL